MKPFFQQNFLVAKTTKNPICFINRNKAILYHTEARVHMQVLQNSVIAQYPLSCIKHFR